MNERAAAFCTKLAAHTGEVARIHAGVADLRDLFRDLIRAYAPPNVQYERERIIAQLHNPREIVFVLGLLSEGENEAALLLELSAATETAEPGADTAHLLDEAWYYLRTSIDAEWQLDDGAPSASAALCYLFTVLIERLAKLLALPTPDSLAGIPGSGRAALLRRLRDSTG